MNPDREVHRSIHPSFCDCVDLGDVSLKIRSRIFAEQTDIREKIYGGQTLVKPFKPTKIHRVSVSIRSELVHLFSSRRTSDDACGVC